MTLKLSKVHGVLPQTPSLEKALYPSQLPLLFILPEATCGLGIHRMPVLPQALTSDTTRSFPNNPLDTDSKSLNSKEVAWVGHLQDLNWE